MSSKSWNDNVAFMVLDAIGTELGHGKFGKVFNAVDKE